jgi:hypothetical protein
LGAIKPTVKGFLACKRDKMRVKRDKMRVKRDKMRVKKGIK